MDLAALLVFAGALVVAAASPGPTIAALVARVIGRGLDGAAAFTAGLMLGDLVWLAVAILGLAVVAQTFHEVFLVIKYAGAAYLLYLAYRMWTAPVAAARHRRGHPSGRRRAPVLRRSRAHAGQSQGRGVLSGAAAEPHRPRRASVSSAASSSPASAWRSSRSSTGPTWSRPRARARCFAARAPCACSTAPAAP